GRPCGAGAGRTTRAVPRRARGVRAVLMRVAWVLNLAAELELSGEPIGRGTRQAIRKGVTFLRGDGGLIESGDAVLDPDGESAAPGMIGLCWSPTPNALEVLARAGIPALAVPADLLR